MKLFFIFFVCVLSGIVVFGQQDCSDVIFAADNNKIIFNCCIKNIVDGNMVIYSKDGQTQRIVALAVSWEGEYIELDMEKNKKDDGFIRDKDKSVIYKGHDYMYYKKLYNGSKTRFAFGIALATVGLAFEIVGLAYSDQYYVSQRYNITSRDLYIAGLLMESVGIPLLISGAVRAKNNNDAMKEIDKMYSLSMGLNQNGFGLRFRF